MAHEKSSSFSLRRVVEADIPALTEISGLSFEKDRHTMLKAAHPTNPYDHAAGMSDAVKHWLTVPSHKVDVIKAVDDESGEILGVVVWWKQLDPPDPAASGKKAQEDAGKDTAVQDDAPDLDALAQLHEITSSHLANFQKRIMPPGTRCLIIGGINVHPNHQGRGVGKALVRHGTDQADAKGVFCWVHSSEAGAPFFRSCGFEVVDELEINLDEWATKMDLPPPAGDSEWGKYTFRYFVRQPRAVLDS